MRRWRRWSVLILFVMAIGCKESSLEEPGDNSERSEDQGGREDITERSDERTAPAGVAEADIELWLSADEGAEQRGTGAVVQWFDRSRQEEHLAGASTGVGTPVVADAANGKPALEFDGRRHYFWTGPRVTKHLTGAKGMSTFAVFEPANVDFRVPLLHVSSAEKANSVRLGLRAMPTAGEIEYVSRRLDKDPPTRLVAQDVSTSSFNVVTGVSDFESGRARLYVGGKEVDAGSVTTGPGPRTNPLRVGVGVEFSLKNSFEALYEGKLAELIVYRKALSDREREKVHQYLADKYGI